MAGRVGKEEVKAKGWTTIQPIFFSKDREEFKLRNKDIENTIENKKKKNKLVKKRKGDFPGLAKVKRDSN